MKTWEMFKSTDEVALEIKAVAMSENPNLALLGRKWPLKRRFGGK